MWHLALKDIQTLTHVYPEMLPAMVEAFRDRWEGHLQTMCPDTRYALEHSLGPADAPIDLQLLVLIEC